MKKSKYCLFALLSVLAAGCSENDPIPTVQEILAKAGGVCEKSADCEDGLDCVKNVCSQYVELNEDCSGKYTVCRKGTCSDGVCTEDDPDEKLECKKDDDCKGSKVCVKNTCLECAKDSDCGDGWECKNNSCVKKEADPPAEETPQACLFDETCEDSSLVCADDGYCRKPAEKNGACSESQPCQTDQFCQNGTCRDFFQPGEACEEDMNCAGDAVCEDVCKTYSVAKSGVCNNEYLFCGDNLTCVNGTCLGLVNINDPCDETTACPDGTVCFANGNESKCIKKLGDCTSDDACGADSYCCSEEACSVKNICIPYGEGPRQSQNLGCAYKTVPGLFEAAIQCEWKAPAADDPYPNHANVLMTPLVMNTPHDSGNAQEIIFTTYNNGDGGAPSGLGSDINFYGVIRIINAETCELHESIFDDNNHIIGGSNIIAADVNNDKNVEIFASRGQAQKTGDSGGLVAFKWNGSKYETWWKTTNHSASTMNWGGPSMHDINDDGIPEIIGYGGEVFRATTGERLNPGQTIAELYYTPTLGDLDNDGAVEIIGTVHTFRWNTTTNVWDQVYAKQTGTGLHPAFADFGTRNSDGTFNPDVLDGRAEIVNCGSGIVQVSTLEGENILRVTGLSGGGPCTVGDFDGDGFPEVATAFGDSYRIFDPRCKTAADGCAKQYILWEKLSQDASSASTGSSLFDFDGDGAMEAVYADECYTRVYDGKTGDVLFSAYRSSATWHENPVIADVDNDESAEIVVGSNNSMGCTSPDPIHRGIRCATDSDCKSNICKLGLCRCSENSQCNWRTDAQGNLLNEYNCVAPLLAEDDYVEGNVCRAVRSNAERVTGVRVMKDRLDRWMSSRNIWNQHAYNITNVNDDQTIPMTSKWIQNFLQIGNNGKLLNNFRQNSQGLAGANRAPDITGRFVGNACAQVDDKIILGAEICNRGTKMVSSLMPASFYLLGTDIHGDETRTLLCTSYTTENVPVGGCLHVDCATQNVVNGRIVLVANDDGHGGKTTVECNENNNEDFTVVESCAIN